MGAEKTIAAPLQRTGDLNTPQSATNTGTIPTSTDMRAEALALAADGWSVLPLHGKIPFTKNGLHDATTDPEIIRSWWQRWPSANIGAQVPDTVVVFDIDPRNGGSVDELGDLPATLTAWSGRRDGGRHLYFIRPLFEMSSAKVPKGIDLKRSGYMVMPPSVHPETGHPYIWEGSEIQPLPLHLLQMVRPKPRPLSPRPCSGNGSHLVTWVAGFADQGVNNALFWAACRAAEDGVLDQVEADLIATAVSVGESERQARATVQSARRKVVG